VSRRPRCGERSEFANEINGAENGGAGWHVVEMIGLSLACHAHHLDLPLFLRQHPIAPARGHGVPLPSVIFQAWADCRRATGVAPFERRE
jgi:hypothetical protein